MLDRLRDAFVFQFFLDFWEQDVYSRSNVSDPRSHLLSANLVQSVRLSTEWFLVNIVFRVRENLHSLPLVTVGCSSQANEHTFRKCRHCGGDDSSFDCQQFCNRLQRVSCSLLIHSSHFSFSQTTTAEMLRFTLPGKSTKVQATRRLDSVHHGEVLPMEHAQLPASTTLADIQRLLNDAATLAAGHFRPLMANSSIRKPPVAVARNGGQGFCENGNHPVSVGTQFIVCGRCQLSVCGRAECRGDINATVSSALREDVGFLWLCPKCVNVLSEDVDDGDLPGAPIDDDDENEGVDDIVDRINSDEDEGAFGATLVSVVELQLSFNRLFAEFSNDNDFVAFRHSEITRAAVEGYIMPWSDVYDAVDESLVPTKILVPNDFFGDRRSQHEIDIRSFLARVVSAARASRDRGVRVRGRQ